jgi:hypothetical protein
VRPRRVVHHHVHGRSGLPSPRSAFFYIPVDEQGCFILHYRFIPAGARGTAEPRKSWHEVRCLLGLCLSCVIDFMSGYSNQTVGARKRAAWRKPILDRPGLDFGANSSSVNFASSLLVPRLFSRATTII